MADTRIVRILGMSLNLQGMPPPSDPKTEAWLLNEPRGYRQRIPRVLLDGEWTRWFNLHSRAHMEEKYPSGLAWYIKQDGSKPVYTQKFWPDIPGCIEFPRQQIQEAFATAKGPNKYFTCTICWLLAFAILEGFTHIELWGFSLRDQKSGETYGFERPCFFYWIQQARDRGIIVTYPKEIEDIPFLPGDPDTYDGPLYGYNTRPEKDLIINA